MNEHVYFPILNPMENHEINSYHMLPLHKQHKKLCFYLEWSLSKLHFIFPLPFIFKAPEVFP